MNKALAALALLVSTAAPAFGVTEPDAMLYELNEDMTMTSTHRLAKSSISGFAAVNTPLCPPAFVSDSGSCVINATGANSIRLSTGRGPIVGTFRNVTQDTNPFDIEEVVRRHGDFAGEMDLSTAGPPILLGRMEGRMNVHGERGRHRFRGVVRIPFACPLPPTGFCYMASGPDAVPLGPEPLLPHEFGLGHPMVRLDIWFE